MSPRSPACGRIDAARYLREGRVAGERHAFDAVDLFLFSAATWNPHRIHYDLGYSTDVEGYPALVVQGPLQAARMCQVLRGSLRTGVRISDVSYRHHALLHAGEPAAIGGEPVEADDPPAGGPGAVLTVRLWVARHGSGVRTTTGLATLTRSAAGERD